MPRITVLSTLTYPDYGAGLALERIAARGFSAVDIAHMGVYRQHFPLGAADTEGRAACSAPSACSRSR